MALDHSQCLRDSLDRLQVSITDLIVSRNALFKRKPGDTDAVRDFVRGQHAILQALDFLCAMPDMPEQKGAEIIQNIWRRYRLGPTLGNGMACQYLIFILYERFSGDIRLDWHGWQPLDWGV